MKLLKNIIIAAVLLVVLKVISKEVIKQQKIEAAMSQLKNQKNVDETNSFEPDEIHETPKHSAQRKHKKTYSSNTVRIVGLDGLSHDDLVYASNIVEKFYGYNTVIEDNEDLSNEFIYDGTNNVNANKFVRYNKNDTKTIYLTYSPVYEGDVKLRGYTLLNGKTILVRGDRSFMQETIIHEVGHTLGLEHCDDLSCIMAINNDQYDSGDFCQRCKNIINR